MSLRRLALLLPFVVPVAARAQTPLTPADSLLARDILKQLIEIVTTDSANRTYEAARAMQDRLLAAGFPAADLHVVGPDSTHGNLVARYRGRNPNASPIVVMSHLDVVPARREDWSTDPYVFTEKDGFYYGRGTSDVKFGCAILVANFIRLKRSGFVPERDIIMTLEGDEETTGASIQYLVAQRRDLLGNPSVAFNTDAGGGDEKDGRKRAFNVQASEKVYASWRLEVTDRGGHSSQPHPGNPIYALAAGLSRLAAFQFPVDLTEITRTFLERSAGIETGQLAADMRAVLQTPPDSGAVARLSESPYLNSKLRTTCVATRLEGGHADNALPQMARATVNCRIMPGTPATEVEATLRRVLADDRITLSPIGTVTPSPPSPLTPAVMGPLERLVAQQFPGVPIIPFMESGATDGLYLRNAGIPTYGVSALFSDPDDERAHGRDERIGVRAYYDALTFWYRLLQTYGGK